MRITIATIAILAFFINVTVVVYKLNQTSVVVPIQAATEIIEINDEPILPKHEQPILIVPDFVDVPVFRSTGETGTVYNDVLSHSPVAPFGNANGRSTNVHETAHGIHSYLRNKYRLETGNRVNGFYVLDGRGVIVEEPNIRKSQINKFVPENVRAYRFKTYLQKQIEWDDTPLYIYDEWAAYILGSKCNLDDVKQNNHSKEWSDGVSATLEFSIYAIATAMAVKEHDPNYWETNQQFKDFTTWMLRESYNSFSAGRDMEEFRWNKQEELLENFLTSRETEQMRDFVREHFDGIWLDAEIKVFYGSDRMPPVNPQCNCKGPHF